MEKETIKLSDYDKLIKNNTRKNITKSIYIQNKIFDFEFHFLFVDYKYHFKNCEFKKIRVLPFEENNELIFQNCTFSEILDISSVKFKSCTKHKNLINEVDFS